MIHDKTYTTPTLVRLIESGHYFYLTGSRYFGGARQNSDYDFFAEYDVELHAWLQALGFEEVLQPVYQDQLVVKVLIYKGSSGLWDEVSIHVQLVEGAALKNKAQENIPKKLMQMTAYHNRSELWNFALNAQKGF